MIVKPHSPKVRFQPLGFLRLKRLTITRNGSPRPSGGSVDSAAGEGDASEPTLDLGFAARKLGQISRSLICLTGHTRADPSTPDRCGDPFNAIYIALDVLRITSTSIIKPSSKWVAVTEKLGQHLHLSRYQRNRAIHALANAELRISPAPGPAHSSSPWVCPRTTKGSQSHDKCYPISPSTNSSPKVPTLAGTIALQPCSSRRT